MTQNNYLSGDTYRFDAVLNRFLSRLQRVSEYCKNNPHGPIPRFRKVEPLYSFARGKLQWCRILKTASSYIRQLDGDESRILSELTFNRVFKLNDSDKQKLNLTGFPDNFHWKKPRFMMVREPYSRMISGYFDRLVTLPMNWMSLGSEIVKWLRPNIQSPEGHDVSFPEFVKYFIRSQKTGWFYDFHFAPMSTKCDPCRFHIDYVAHMETMKDDMKFIVDIASDENITARINSQDFKDNTGNLMAAKVRSQLKYEKYITQFVSMCDAFDIIWWSFKARGFIPRDLPFPLSREHCDNDETNVLTSRFIDVSIQSYLNSRGKLDKRKQAREIMVELFLQVPLKDRIQVRNILATDFRLFDYDPQPRDLFPELQHHSRR